ncbi:Histidine phosphatase superfamily (branch 1) [Paenibacillus algorifonticola]|uniref:Histidine phosphatase superfamily (Branch 1) n=1 Tax=Paenibacillus algorifonticola TaxID=684063 RepID=A0A1I2J3R5_9BACL|nr:histidine phosphatase family protein [Paenibacillus algorifonticola]SFF47371.1 Histidine phosphatase superfamily (branch 1) [Paenibacillus algorifonticola]
MYGPITAQKYQGEWNGVKESIEVWTVAGSSIVEITTEALGIEAAQSSHALMENLLQQQNLLPLQPGLSKTGWALKKLLQTISDPFSLLLQGGFNLYFRHAKPESTVDDEVMLSQSGQEQARKLGELLSARKIPIQLPVSASPINRARQTAEIAFSEKNIQIEPQLIQKNHLPQLLEVVPKQGFNQVFVAHQFTFNNQLKEFDDLLYLGMVLLKPLGEGKGYTVVQVLDLLQEALIKHSSDVPELTLKK